MIPAGQCAWLPRISEAAYILGHGDPSCPTYQIVTGVGDEGREEALV